MLVEDVTVFVCMHAVQGGKARLCMCECECVCVYVCLCRCLSVCVGGDVHGCVWGVR